MHHWKMIAPEKDGMENDSPGKRQKMTGLENYGKCTTGNYGIQNDSP